MGRMLQDLTIYQGLWRAPNDEKAAEALPHLIVVWQIRMVRICQRSLVVDTPLLL